MRRQSKNQPLTYEELARKYDITPIKVHSVIKSAYNKMVKGLMEVEGVNIFDAVLTLREYFNMTEAEAVEKLNDEHREMLKRYATKEYNMGNKEIETPLTELFED